MATKASLARPRTLRATSLIRTVAADLDGLYAADPAYGLPFCRALRRVVAHAATAQGIAYVPLAAAYRVQSASCAGQWYTVTAAQCSCAAQGLWCWHRALVYLLTARVLVCVDQRDQPAWFKFAS